MYFYQIWIKNRMAVFPLRNAIRGGRAKIFMTFDENKKLVSFVMTWTKNQSALQRFWWLDDILNEKIVSIVKILMTFDISFPSQSTVFSLLEIQLICICWTSTLICFYSINFLDTVQKYIPFNYLYVNIINIFELFHWFHNYGWILFLADCWSSELSQVSNTHIIKHYALRMWNVEEFLFSFSRSSTAEISSIFQ